MDLYLEDPSLWPDVPHEFLSVAGERLNRRLRPPFLMLGSLRMVESLWRKRLIYVVCPQRRCRFL